MLSLFRKPKRQDDRPTKADISRLIERRKQVVDQLTAHQIDVDLRLLEALFGVLEEMGADDRLLVANAADLIKLPEGDPSKWLVFGGLKNV